MDKTKDFAQELKALGVILETLEPLDEAQRRFVLNTAVERLSISNIAGAKLPQVGTSVLPTGSSRAVADQTPIEQQTPKNFIKSKNPQTDVQRIVCLAYYLTYGRSQNHFKTGDLRKLNTESAAPKLSNPAVSIANATTQNRFLSPAGGGKKQITPLGEEVVNALPNQQAVKDLVASQRLGNRKKKKSKKAVVKAK